MSWQILDSIEKIVGSLIYVMTNTRPDICYAATKLSQFMSNPSKIQFNLAKNILRYLKGIENLVSRSHMSTQQ